ncbi:uncharacterized protein LOC126657103 [Mercurialis annua]|uniref:uncharacterized protein LOC126657103 n=1 Tax=Mercurialis annua TaxID=3986 RepID=UPI00215DE383|nr:uncharacterized protein LOC126657103 [Mercurialis annua]
MDGDLNEMYAQLRLTDCEQSVVTLEDVVDEEINDKADLSLVGRLLTKKPYNLIHMKNALTSAWRLAKGFELRDIGDNLFVCEFNAKQDRARILSEAPWHFDKQLILFEPLHGNMQPNNMLLMTVPAWVRIYDLPLNYRGKGAITKIGSKIGAVIDWKEDDGGRWGRYGRVRVMLDVSKPIIRGTKIANSLGELSWVSFKYERIHNYCYWCGMLDHLVAECEIKPEHMEVSDWPYGPNLRATPKKRQLMGTKVTSFFRNQLSDESTAATPQSSEGGMNRSARRGLNLQEEQCGGSFSNHKEDQQMACVAEKDAQGEVITHDQISSKNVDHSFVEINIAQVSSLSFIPDKAEASKKNAEMSKKGGKADKKGSRTRSMGHQSGKSMETKSGEGSGTIKRGFAAVQSSTDPSNFFSKRARDEFVGHFESCEISAETVKQSRRTP